MRRLTLFCLVEGLNKEICVNAEKVLLAAADLPHISHSHIAIEALMRFA